MFENIKNIANDFKALYQNGMDAQDVHTKLQQMICEAEHGYYIHKMLKPTTGDVRGNIIGGFNKKKVYRHDFEEMVYLVETKQIKVKDAAKKLEISPQTYHRWVRLYIDGRDK